MGSIFFRNTTTIRDTRETKMTFDGKIARLTISDCKREFSGTYKIIVKNEFGQNESEAELVVKGLLN